MDGTRIFVPTTTGIMAYPKSGASAETLFPSDGGSPYRDGFASVGYRDGVVFTCGFQNSSNGQGDLLAIPTDGGNARVLSSFDGGVYFCRDVLADSQHVYVTASTGSGDNLYSVPLAGGDLTHAASQVLGFDVENGEIYFLTPGGGLEQMQLMQLQPDGGALQQVGTGSYLVGRFAGTPPIVAAGDALAFLYGDYDVGLVTTAGGAIGGYHQQANLVSIGSDGTSLFWSRGAVGTGQIYPPQNASIWQGSLDGGPPTQLTDGGSTPLYLLVDPDAIYFLGSISDGGSSAGALLKLAR